MSDTDMRKGYDPVTVHIYDRKKKVLTREPSLIAIDRQTNKVEATGSEALPFLHSTNSSVIVLCPLKHGHVADYALAQYMFRSLLQKASLVKPLGKPKIAVSFPGDSTEVEQKALQDALYQSGAGKVLFSEGSIEAMDRSVPEAYHVLMEIDADEPEAASGGCSWSEVKKGQIPAGSYHIAAVADQGAGISITLTGRSCRAQLYFPETLAVRMLDKQVIPDDLYSSADLQKYRQNQFQNVIYEIEHGEFSRFFNENPNVRSKVRILPAKHYLIMGDDRVMEILSAAEPDIAIHHD